MDDTFFDHISYDMIGENSVTPIKEEDVMEFSEHWTRIVGPTASVKHGLTLSISRLPVLLMAVPQPLGKIVSCHDMLHVRCIQ